MKKHTYSNIKIDLADNLESMEQLSKGNALRITQFLLYGLGATLVGVEIANGLGNNNANGSNNKGI